MHHLFGGLRHIRKQLSMALVAATAAVVAIGSTWAYSDFTQHKSNELEGTGLKYDASLVENFAEVTDWKITDGQVQKEVRAANNGIAAEGFGDVYVRLQFKEYMEIGILTYTYSQDRYMIDTDGNFIVFATKDEAEAAYPDHEYANATDFVSGASGWFVLTQAGDPNGQYGKFMITSITPSNEMTPLIPGTSRESGEASANHEAGDNQECAYPVHSWITPLSTADYVEWQLGPNIIPLSQWDGNPVAAWILDDSSDSGYAYWGQPLGTSTETTNILDSVSLLKQPDGSFYYAIHTDMESVSFDQLSDWTDMPQEVSDSFLNNKPAVLLSNIPASVMAGGKVNGPDFIVTPASSTQSVTWSSSDPSVASVDANTGEITGVTAGKTTISALAPNGARSYFVIRVSAAETPATGITLSNAPAQAAVGQSAAGADYALTPAGSTDGVTWSSGNPAVASVDPLTGAVTGVAVGTAVITAKTDSGKTASYSIEIVAASVPSTDITLSGAPGEVAVNGSAAGPTVTLYPAGSTDNVTWSSSAPAVAAVDPTTGKVTGVSAGQATITARTDSGKTASYVITVTPEVIPATAIALSGAPAGVTAGDAVNGPSVILTPTGSTDNVTWSSSNPAVADVDPATGKVTGVAPGSATITAKTDSGKTASYNITVSAASVPATGITLSGAPSAVATGDTAAAANYTLTPAGSTDGVTWSSSNPAVADVDPATGKVTGVAVGQATITARTDSGKTASYNIDVTAGAIALIAPLDPSVGYISMPQTFDQKDEGMLIQSDDAFVTVQKQAAGAIHLSDILVNMSDAVGMTVAPAPGSPYSAADFSIGNSNIGGLMSQRPNDPYCILYTAIPTRAQALADYAANSGTRYPITTDLVLTTADGRTATITITMSYNAMVMWD
ncbi:MAG: Ig-like domain-containing protein [Firmicutes bacterium]|nr:Ig-like domain-containing protein [Bacillota bacterium]